jgi:hypothetical protein
MKMPTAKKAVGIQENGGAAPQDNHSGNAMTALRKDNID